MAIRSSSMLIKVQFVKFDPLLKRKLTMFLCFFFLYWSTRKWMSEPKGESNEKWLRFQLINSKHDDISQRKRFIFMWTMSNVDDCHPSFMFRIVKTHWTTRIWCIDQMYWSLMNMTTYVSGFRQIYRRWRPFRRGRSEKEESRIGVMMCLISWPCRLSSTSSLIFE